MMQSPTSETVINTETELEVHRITYNWEIKHFDRLCPPDAQEFDAFTSNFFRGGEQIGKDSLWAISIDNEDGYLQIWCHLEKIYSKDETEVRALISMAIMKPDKTEAWHRSCSKCHLFSPGTEDNGWGLSNIIRLQKMWDEKNQFLIGNTLRLRITLDLYGDIVYRPVTQLCGKKRKRESGSQCLCSSSKPNESLDALQKDMAELLNSQKDSDFTIQCGTKLFPVHKLVISARSKVFAAMLAHDSLEVQTATVKIEDVNEDILEEMVKYIYTGKISPKPNIEVLMSLVQAADKYELDHLKTKCFYKLCCKISVENVGKLAVLAYLHNAEEDVTSEIRFFFQNHWGTLMKSLPFRECIIANPAAFFKPSKSEIFNETGETSETENSMDSSSKESN